jgi:hypothetical protein
LLPPIAGIFRRVKAGHEIYAEYYGFAKAITVLLTIYYDVISI